MIYPEDAGAGGHPPAKLQTPDRSHRQNRNFSAT